MRRSIILSLIISLGVLIGGVARESPTITLIDGGTLLLEIDGLIIGSISYSLAQRDSGGSIFTGSQPVTFSDPPYVISTWGILDEGFRPLEYFRFELAPNGSEVLLQTFFEGNSARISLRNGGETSETELTTEREFALFDNQSSIYQALLLVHRLEALGLESMEIDAILPTGRIAIPARFSSLGETVLVTNQGPVNVDEYLFEDEMGLSILIHTFTQDGRYVAGYQEPNTGNRLTKYYNPSRLPTGFEIP